MRHEIEQVLKLSASIPPDELIQFLSDIEQVRLSAQVRLMTAGNHHHDTGPDKLLTIDEAAARLAMSIDYLYRHKFPFTVREGGSIRFSSHGIDRWIERKGKQ